MKVKEIINGLLIDSPEFYASTRLQKELTEYPMNIIREALLIEINLYEQLPYMLLKNYESTEHLLAYISAVKSYPHTLE